MFIYQYMYYRMHKYICTHKYIIHIYIYCHLIYDKSANEIQWGKTGVSINDNGVRDPMNKK